MSSAVRLLKRFREFLEGLRNEDENQILVDNAPAISLYRKTDFIDHMILMSRPL